MNSSKFDHILIRSKDVLLIIATLIGFAAWTVNFFNLPKTVARHETEIATINRIVMDYKSSNELSVQGLRQEVSYLSKNIEEIKQIVKATASRL